MKDITRTILKDIIVLSAQVVAYRLAMPAPDQQNIIFAATPVPSIPDGEADPNAPQARRIGF
jgi:hypothetical protein